MYVLYIYIYVSVISILTEIWVSYAQKGGKVYSWPNVLNFTFLVSSLSRFCLMYKDHHRVLKLNP